MTASKNSQEQVLPEKEEFFDAIRRHICQALGFDFVFVDYVREPEIINLISFSAEDEDTEAREFVGTLSDENQQPLTVANTHVAQDVKKTQRPWIGKAYMASGAVPAEPESELDDDDEDSDGLSAEKEGYPYSIVPILQTPHGNAGTVRGLIRVLSFDPTREITQQDLATLKLMGEHLSTKMSQFAPNSDAQPAEANRVSFDSEFVLIVHSNRLVRRRYSRILGEKYQVLEADSADKATEALQNNRVDLIVLDSEVKGKSGYAFCRVLKESNQFKHVPVILVTSDTNPTARVDGLNVGADDCLSESCFDSELLARVKSSMRHRKTERELAIQLQLLEDYAQRLEQATEHLSQDKQLQLKRNRELELLRWESDILRSQDTLLHRISNTIRQSFNITENLHKMLEAFSGWFNLDCCFVVLPSDDEPEDSIRSEYFADEEYQLMQQDVDLRTLEVFKQHFQGEQLLMANDAAHDRRLEPFRKDALPNYHFFSLFFVPITYEQKLLGLLGGYKCESQANWNRDNEAFLKSVADQVATGVTNARLYARVQRQATTDGLTGLYNHRTGQEKLAEQLRLAERYQRNLAVVMLDVDHFKSINDNYGHPAGDSVLKAVAKLVKSNCRDVDLPVRYGGEEFLVVLPEVNQEGAAVVAERIRKSLSQEIIHHEDIQISVTGSFGIAAFPEDAHNQQHLLDLADKALYLSKRLGRNQVHTAGDLMFEEISPSKPPEQPPRADTQRKNEAESSADETTEKSGQEKDVSPPAVVTNSGQFTLPQNTYADFVPTAVSAAAEQKEELVPEVVDMVKALATALYSKSDYNKQHHLETARLSELLAKVMGLSQQQVEQIRVAGLLHDVGTLSIPADLINKPGKYNADEREIINQHAVLGAQLLRPIRALRDICEILENHHERWDGTGYPRGLKGEEIPLPARIVSIVDSYHAMISDRPYRPAMTREQAIQTLKNGAGLQWDPFLVDIFVAVLASLNDPRSAPLSAPTPATPRVEALTNDQSKPAPQAASNSAQSLSVPTTEQSADSSVNQSPLESAETASHTVEKVEDDGSEQPVLNARQRLLQHSQQHQPLQLAQQDSSASGDRTDASETPSRPASDIDTSDNLTPVSGNISVTAQVSSGREIDDLKDEEFGESEDEEQDDDDDYEDEASPASLSPTTQSAQPQGTPSALEQLRRIPPEQQAAIFHQASQRASELPAHAQQGLAPQRSDSQAPMNPATPVQAAPTHTAPQSASAQAPTQAPAAVPHAPATPVVQNASALFSRAPYDASAQRPQPLPQQQAPGQNISQPPPQQPAPGQHISQPLPQQPAPAQHISQPLPQQPAPAQHSQPMPQPQAPAQHISQPLPQQQASGQHISQPLPQQQASGQHISQPLPQQQAPAQHISQPLPQQQSPAQHISQPLPQQPQPNSQFSQQQRAFPSPTQNQQQTAQQPSSAAQPVTPNTVPQPTAPQTPQTHNLFPHLQQLQNQPGQNPAVWQQPYASQSPYANPTEQKPASQPAQQELSAQQPTAEQDSEQFYEEP
ncbi:MAG: diguanylate cyclase [Candidatus Melainabacteria bacterium]|nr:MAG: diguanylate cyclase [Candidatus Melainabacteria bacterium]